MYLCIFIHLLQQLFIGQSDFIQGQTVMARQNLKQNTVLCRNPSIISAFVFVAPALPSTSTKKKNEEEKQKKQDSKDSFIWRASFGQQLQRLYMRALLQNENAGELSSCAVMAVRALYCSSFSGCVCSLYYT